MLEKKKEPILRTPNEEDELLAKKEEPRFLSVILKHKEKLQDAISFGITHDHFRFKENAFLYRVAVKNCEKHNSLLTKGAMDSIMDQQPNYTEEQKSARKMHWHKVYGMEPNAEDYERLKENLNGRYLQDQAYTIFQKRAPELIGATVNQAELVKQIQQDFNSLEGVDADAFDLIVPFDEGSRDAMKHIQERREHPERNQGVLTGIKGIDEEFYGFDYGSYTVISGMTNGGKTTLMFNIGFNMARNGKVVVYVSLEKKALPLDVRLLCLHAMVDYNRVKKGGSEEWGLSDDVMSKLDEAHRELSEDIKPEFIIVQLSQDDTLTKIISKIEEIKTTKKIDVVILDYLGCVGVETKTQGRHDIDQANVSKRFQTYCKRNNFVGITGCQINRASTKEIRKATENVGESEDIQKIAVQSEDLAGSQEVIRDADNGIGIVLNADNPPTKAYVHGTKSRDNQGHRTIELDFDGRIGRISDPVFEIGEIKDIDDIIYNNNISLQDIQNSEDLFASLEDSEDIQEPDSIKEDPKKEIKEELKEEPKKEIKEEKNTGQVEIAKPYDEAVDELLADIG